MSLLILDILIVSKWRQACDWVILWLRELLFARIFHRRHFECREDTGDEVSRADTVNSRYFGHSWDRDLVSVLARVRNSGVREKNLRK